jgi:preprotein translocase subunit SecA
MPKSGASSDWDLQGLTDSLARDFNVTVDPKTWLVQEPDLEEQTLRTRIIGAVKDAYDARTARSGTEIMRHIEKEVMLKMLDQHWREHLAAMDYLRQGIHLRGYAQKDYRFEYKREAFELFAAMLDRVKFETVTVLAKIEVRTQDEIDREEEERRLRLMRQLQAQHAEAQSLLAAESAVQQAPPVPGSIPLSTDGSSGFARGGVLPMPPPTDESHGTFVRGERKIGRNEPCPCGSGKKYKNCHGALSGIG